MVTSWVKWKSRALMALHTGSVRLYVTLFLSAAVLLYPFFLWYGYQEKQFLIFQTADETGATNTSKVHEVICPPNAEHCFKVEDFVTGDIYARRLMVEADEDVVLSVAELINERDEPFTRKNSRNWPIRKEHLLLGYSKVTIAQAFATGTFILGTPDSVFRTLMIGLGGAGILHYISTLPGNHEIISVDVEPAMEYIATKWFGVTASRRHQIVIQDGVDFLAGRSNWAPKFDFIVIDACHIDLEDEYELLCPAKPFVEDEVIGHIRRLLSSKGTVAVNTFVLETPENAEEVKHARVKLMDAFKRHFNNCYYADEYVNKILTCTLSLNLMMTQTFYRQIMDALPDKLKRELRFRDVQIIHDIL
ncbi:methyltransferase-like protein 13 [Ditylenchus destructor]|uniref:Methyltransferase-like protein 13 n=1 Tax=Ditylenchus destructor TaxID=166010 RepID=A0AAD4MYE8_9BILA|nr:methyltransferase-like protein 13 [Ditylenchus destructor]